MSDWYKKVAQGWLISVHVQPGAKRSEIAGLHGDALKIRIASLPVDGRANEALIAFVAGKLGVPRAALSLEHGAGSRRKTLLLAARIDPSRLLLQ
ncbi:MAG: hypothetical protein A3H35_12065 [Betaproteobacteria bacterium RIFCSPLOWO2_02_FULL_62_17]|nr:MAG: hypothetical protein A3H35_12065 [Betaproteobacteria bacterium RIFCSPLOWO2_02_FULL_62_17]